MIDIPYDIWLHVAQFIPSEILRNLYSVNRAFFDLAMNERYRRVEIYDATRKTIRKLDYLTFVIPTLLYFHSQALDILLTFHTRDATPAQRVRCLYFRPSSIQEMLRAERKWSYKVLAFMNWMGNLKSLTRNPCGHEVVTKKPESLKHLKASDVAIKAITNLSHVTDYTINWHEDIPLPLLTVVRSVFSPRIIRLILHGSLESIPNLLGDTCSSVLSNLEELEISLWPGMSDSVVGSTDCYRMLALLPFISSVSATLRSLTISMSCHIDPSGFFDGVGHLPCLNILALRFLLDEIHVPDLTSFKCFLNHHSDTLHHLSLSTSFCRFSHPDLVGWGGPGCLSGVTLRNLHSLHISAFLMSGGNNGISGSLISLAGVTGTLAFLSIYHYHCTYDDIKALLVNLSIAPKLVTLALPIKYLCAEQVAALSVDYRIIETNL